MDRCELKKVGSNYMLYLTDSRGKSYYISMTKNDLIQMKGVLCTQSK